MSEDVCTLEPGTNVAPGAQTLTISRNNGELYLARTYTRARGKSERTGRAHRDGAQCTQRRARRRRRRARSARSSASSASTAVRADASPSPPASALCVDTLTRASVAPNRPPLDRGHGGAQGRGDCGPRGLPRRRHGRCPDRPAAPAAVGAAGRGRPHLRRHAARDHGLGRLPLFVHLRPHTLAAGAGQAGRVQGHAALQARTP